MAQAYRFTALGWGGATQLGSIRAETEFWNGSTWTELNDLNQSKTLDAGAGTVYTSSLSFGGRNLIGTRIALTESFNGTNWTEVNDLNTVEVSYQELVAEHLDPSIFR